MISSKFDVWVFKNFLLQQLIRLVSNDPKMTKTRVLTVRTTFFVTTPSLVILCKSGALKLTDIAESWTSQHKNEKFNIHIQSFFFCQNLRCLLADLEKTKIQNLYNKIPHFHIYLSNRCCLQIHNICFLLLYSNVSTHRPFFAAILFDPQPVTEGDPARHFVCFEGVLPADIEIWNVVILLHQNADVLRRMGLHCQAQKEQELQATAKLRICLKTHWYLLNTWSTQKHARLVTTCTLPCCHICKLKLADLN